MWWRHFRNVWLLSIFSSSNRFIEFLISRPASKSDLGDTFINHDLYNACVSTCRNSNVFLFNWPSCKHTKKQQGRLKSTRYTLISHFSHSVSMIIVISDPCWDDGPTLGTLSQLRYLFLFCPTPAVLIWSNSIIYCISFKCPFCMLSLDSLLYGNLCFLSLKSTVMVMHTHIVRVRKKKHRN